MSILGTLGVAILGIRLWSVNGTLPEVWPNRCSLFKAQLVQEVEQLNALSSDRGSPLNVMVVPQITAERSSLWQVERGPEQTRLFIPKRDFVEARVSAQPLAPVWVELIDRDGERVVAHLRAD
jgi:hypothetical protein